MCFLYYLLMLSNVNYNPTEYLKYQIMYDDEAVLSYTTGVFING